jgi:hypothetical protein
MSEAPFIARNVQFSGSSPGGGHGSASFDVFTGNAYLAPHHSLKKGEWVVIYDDAHELYEGEIFSVKPSVDSSGQHKFSVVCGGLISVAGQRADVSATWVHRGSEGWIRRPGTPSGLGNVNLDTGIELRISAGATEVVTGNLATNQLCAVFALDGGLSDDVISHVDCAGLYAVDVEGAKAWTWTLWANTATNAISFGLGPAWTKLVEGATGNSALWGNDGSCHYPTLGGGTWKVLALVLSSPATVPTADKFFKLTTCDIFCGGRTTKPRIDEAMVALATRTGLALTSYSEAVGGMLDDLRVGNGSAKVTVAAGLDYLAKLHAQPFEWGFWDEKTFTCKPLALAPNDSHTVVVGGNRPGLESWDVVESDEGLPDYVCVLFGNLPDKGDATLPEAWPRRIYRPALPVPADTARLNIATLDFTDRILSDVSAAAIGDNRLGAGLTAPLFGFLVDMDPFARQTAGDAPGGFATGGTVTYDGDYTVHKFTSSGNLVIPAGASATAEVLVVGGGGGGAAGGGGAGGYLSGTQIVAGTMAVTVGGGGTGVNPDTAVGGSGGFSEFGSRRSSGGGGGASINGNGVDGGSGGGGSWAYVYWAHADTVGGNASGTPATQGNRGGGNAGWHGSEPYPSGGGGGAGGVGGSATGDGAAAFGAGGIGLSNSITGSSATYAVGGVGTHSHAGNGSAAGANTGNGGGACGRSDGGGTYLGGNGGSGIVVIRYLTGFNCTTTTTGWLGSNSPADPTRLVFDGSNDYVTFYDLAALDLGSGNRSVAAWVKFNVVNAQQAIFSKMLNSGTNIGWEFRLETDGKLMAAVNQDAASVYRNAKDTAALTAGLWYHVAAVYGAGAWTLYVNGAARSISAGTAGGVPSSDNSTAACLGSRAAAALWLNGSLQRTTVWGRALTAGEVANLYGAGMAAYTRSMANGTVVLKGTCQTRKGSPVPAHHVRAGWSIQNVEAGSGQPLYVTGHSVDLADKRNALTIGVDWMEEEIGVRMGELLAVPATATEDEELPTDPEVDDPGMTDPGIIVEPPPPPPVVPPPIIPPIVPPVVPPVIPPWKPPPKPPPPPPRTR